MSDLASCPLFDGGFVSYSQIVFAKHDSDNLRIDPFHRGYVYLQHWAHLWPRCNRRSNRERTSCSIYGASDQSVFSHLPELVGLAIVIGFAFLLGFGATLAEPALKALGVTVQNLTNRAFKKEMLMYSVATGVAIGIALGISKLVLGFDLMMVLLPLYGVGVVLTIIFSEEFVNVAWDSAGVTTGPVTVPLVLAMGLGLGNAVSAVEGFGILSLARICPIIAVLTMGVVIRVMNKGQAD